MTYEIPIKIVFEGTVEIDTDDFEEAKALAQDVTATIDNISAEDEHIKDWNIDMVGYAELAEDKYEGDE